MKTYLSFEAQNEFYGISTDDVVEILQDLQVREIPRSNPYVFGIAKFRDEFIVVLDLYMLLNQDKNVQRDQKNIVVVDVRFGDRDLRVGLNVDSIDNVIDVNEESIQAPDSQHAMMSDYIHGIHYDNERFIFLLQNNMLVNSKEIEFLLDLSNKSVVKEEQAKKKNQSITKLETYLTFSLASEQIAFPALMVKEVINEFTITEIPLAESELDGIINLRGNIVPVINVNRKFGVPQNSNRPCIAIMEMKTEEGDVLVGALMDKVNDVLDIPMDKIETQNLVESNYNPEFIKGVYHLEKDYIRMINVSRLLSTNHVTLV